MDEPLRPVDVATAKLLIQVGPYFDLAQEKGEFAASDKAIKPLGAELAELDLNVADIEQLSLVLSWIEKYAREMRMVLGWLSDALVPPAGEQADG